MPHDPGRFGGARGECDVSTASISGSRSGGSTFWGRRRIAITEGRPLALAALYVLICLIWGTTWLGIRLGTETIPPITAAGLRFLGAFPLLVLVVRRWPGARLAYPRTRHWLFAFVVLAYLVVPYALLNYAERSITSGLTAILFSSLSLFLVFFARLLLGSRVQPRQALGVVIGVMLLAFLVTTGRGGLAATNLLAPAAVLVAAALHGLSYVVIKRWGADIHALTIEALPIGVTGVALTALGFAFEHPDLAHVSLRSALGIGYLAVVPSVVGFAVYFYLLQRIEPVLLSFVFVFFPVVALGVSSLAEHAPLPLGSVVIVVGMLGAFALTKSRDGGGKARAKDAGG